MNDRDKLLFTPGPLTTSLAVKQAMLHDAGSWHFEFNQLVKTIREKILNVAGIRPGEGYETVLFQGSGTYGIEAVLGSAAPAHGKVLVIANGAYGERMAQITRALKIDTVVMRCEETQIPDLDQIEATLAGDLGLTHVALVHCETTTGILNPIHAIGQVIKRYQRIMIVDAMSSFGALPLDLPGTGIDFLISSPNKCLEGVPGFCFVIANQSRLRECEGRARSLSLDLFGQWQGFEKNGQFRFTPPTHTLLAFAQALREWQAEGGWEKRIARYATNHSVLLRRMTDLGFVSVLPPQIQSPIITAFHYPDDSAFEFTGLYRRLSERGMIIYPGKLTRMNTFRIGTIGRLFIQDIVCLTHAIEDALSEMGCHLPLA